MESLQQHRGKQIYKDIFSVRYIINNSSGAILQDTKNMTFQPDQLHTIYSLWVIENGTKTRLNYAGTNCSVGWVDIFLKKINNTQISWEYRPDDIVTISSKCPSNLNTTIYLSETKDLIFIKQ
ncbi:hypothetical protein [Chryseobacterium sp. ISL-6]|uniref:hypothetical protein n=1 Tax=Chryseobacterium sp. ISL-6 TaxID=2819143 RepID=UPI001BEC64C9|nr:hypothetical protein [Chryseobacterium sp. ISL-6]MBT2620741.1 hypothetical protein [Chryseobacterium sp. ISL-6]